ncbi:tetratricopeptide repeat protein [Pseudoduganella eburnea]|uniref:Tetratricopeptide repeat protein n=1 Tax=Massilia eburnea TaxID=1776165 RepID=A0A6L6QNK1_9BURK|nr:tetratricopeptide repeat protein [Massilia eburnea]MTW13949.1 tetratricopeptide repeat protein [Massilia eburnea]
MQGFLILLAALAADCPPYSKGATGGDYYNAEDAKGLTVVETFHFGPQVETLQRGMTGTLGADLGYTLEHFPNHPRALAAMARLALRSKARQAPGAPLTVECYFQRALAYVPSDGATRALYGAYLLSMKRDAEAVEQLQAALEFQETNAAAWYNLGLAQVRLKNWPAALASARKAYGQGFPLPGLRQQLKEAGQWREPQSFDPMVAH